MQKPFRLKIKVPGTSANLGSGFDIMGLALNIHNEFTFEFSKSSSFHSSLRNGGELPFSVQEDLVLSSYKIYFQKFIPNIEPPPYDVIMDLSLPLKGGLGSSASACVAGFVAANELHKKKFQDFPVPKEKDMLYELAKIEGHPDNTTPAYLGGLVFSFFTENENLHYFRKKIPSNIKLYLFIPCCETDTNHSRKKLPLDYPVSDVIFNMARIGTWMEFLGSKKYNHLLLALEDKIHTPYRLKSEVAIKKIFEFSKHQNIGFALSGSGPTVLFFVERKISKEKSKYLAHQIQQISTEHNLRYKFTPIEPDNKGTVIKIY